MNQDMQLFYKLMLSGRCNTEVTEVIRLVDVHGYIIKTKVTNPKRKSLRTWWQVMPDGFWRMSRDHVREYKYGY